MLGLTLAELLLLLLFLFLLVATSLLFDRDKAKKELQGRLTASETERMAFRSALGDELDLAQFGGRVLTPAELSTPLASIKQLAQQKDDLADKLNASRTELSAIRNSSSPSATQMSQLREQNDALKAMLDRAKADSQDYSRFKARAAAMDPSSDSAKTIDTALRQMAESKSARPTSTDPLGQCKAELSNANSRYAHAEAQCHSGDYPPCVYRDDGRAAYVYEVSLTQAGAIVRPGDTGSFEQIPWVSALPKLPLGEAISSDKFIELSTPYRLAGDKQSPACRFYIRVTDDMGNASREDFKQLYLSVQSNFYHHLER